MNVYVEIFVLRNVVPVNPRWKFDGKAVSFIYVAMFPGRSINSLVTSS